MIALFPVGILLEDFMDSNDPLGLLFQSEVICAQLLAAAILATRAGHASAAQWAAGASLIVQQWQYHSSHQRHIDACPQASTDHP